MRILDEARNQSIDSVLLMLTPNEAAELASKMRSLDVETGEHLHINDVTYQWEIKVAVYTPENLKYFSPEIKKLLEE